MKICLIYRIVKGKGYQKLSLFKLLVFVNEKIQTCSILGRQKTKKNPFDFSYINPPPHPREALADYLASILDPKDERNIRDKRSGGLSEQSTLLLLSLKLIGMIVL